MVTSSSGILQKCVRGSVQLRHHGLGSRKGIPLSAIRHMCGFSMKVGLQSKGEV